MSDRRRKTYRAILALATILLGLNLIHDLHLSVDLSPVATGALATVSFILGDRLFRNRGDQ